MIWLSEGRCHIHNVSLPVESSFIPCQQKFIITFANILFISNTSIQSLSKEYFCLLTWASCYDVCYYLGYMYTIILPTIKEKFMPSLQFLRNNLLRLNKVVRSQVGQVRELGWNMSKNNLVENILDFHFLKHNFITNFFPDAITNGTGICFKESKSQTFLCKSIFEWVFHANII